MMEKVTREQFEARTGFPADGGRDAGRMFVPGWKKGDTLYCLHCDGSFHAGAELVDAADGLLVCPNQGCNGTPLDWSREPWWRGQK